MTPEQFIRWLIGYTAALETPEDPHLATIRAQLALVRMQAPAPSDDIEGAPV